ncbi:MAG: DUF2155 domain-containing protein [Hyphomicrobiales bacterium]|nr:DUF2155 domain-containing protein [Hyphomicrobiales bacterium]MDE2114911.1 DUF2155 domain-containing protein [Hyphomicrobiales bacterium]
MNMRGTVGRTFAKLACVGLGLALVAMPARADHIENPTATFSGLDKITGRIIHFSASINETVQFGSLLITPRVCDSRPATQAPQTESFIQVDRVNAANNFKRIFSGWVFASSPGLNGIEDPIYDIWLTNCSGGTTVIASEKPPSDDNAISDTPSPAETMPLAPAPVEPLAPKPRPKPPVRRPPAELAPRSVPKQRFYPTNTHADFPGAPQGVY